MTAASRLLLVYGAASPPGRLFEALRRLSSKLAEQRPGLDIPILDLHATHLDLCDGRPDHSYSTETQMAVSSVGTADAVIFASPTYRASYTGVLKNLIDLLPVPSLRGKPVGIVAMGASDHHYLGVDSQLRFVLAWFGAWVLPTSVYLTSRDFVDGRLCGSAVEELVALGAGAVEASRRLERTLLGPPPLASRTASEKR